MLKGRKAILDFLYLMPFKKVTVIDGDLKFCGNLCKTEEDNELGVLFDPKRTPYWLNNAVAETSVFDRTTFELRI